jgi:putative sterol carrier protein
MKTPGRYRQIFLYAAPFVALVFFKIWTSMFSGAGALFPAACAALVYCFLVLALAWRWDRPAYFDWTVAAYFLSIAVLLFVRPEQSGLMLKRYATAGIYLCLFVASFLPPVLGFAPFTLHYSKKSTPPVLWENPVFVTINRIMTFTWAGIFGICLLLSLYPSVMISAILPIIIMAGFGIPFNIRFPDYYLRRLGLPPLASMRAASANQAAEAEAHVLPESRVPGPDFTDHSVPNTIHKERSMETPRPIPRPDSIESFMNIMSIGFNPERAAQLKAVIQFNFSGEVPGSCHFEIEHGEIRTKEGISPNPNLVVESPFEIWMDVITGKVQGQDMYMQQKFKASGDFMLLLRMNEIFSKR